MQFTICHSTSEIQNFLAPLRASGKKIALVPTMGALHAGHLSLIETAKTHADIVVAYIFVNPAQFGPNEDFSRYPRTWESDIEKLRTAGIDSLYAPSTSDVYPEGFSSCVSVGPLSTILCGAFRPVFFDGIATVLTKMFLRVQPHIAVFGEKDYQQLLVIRQLVRDLDIPVEVISSPTLREEDGLAMSSRNTYLSLEERQIASMLYRTLTETKQALIKSPAHVADILEFASSALLKHGFTKVDYVALCDATTLASLKKYRAPARLLAAAWLGSTRLIDNIEIAV